MQTDEWDNDKLQETPYTYTSYLTHPLYRLYNGIDYYVRYLINTKYHVSSACLNSLDIFQLNPESYFIKNISNCVILSDNLSRFKVVEFLLRNWRLTKKDLELDIDLISYGYHTNPDNFMRVNNFIKGVSTENVSTHMVNLSLDKNKATLEYKRLLEEYESQNMSGIVPINKYRLVIVDNVETDLMNLKFSVAPHIILLYLTQHPIVPSTVSYIVSNVNYIEFMKPYLGNVYDQLSAREIIVDKSIYVIANVNSCLTDLSDLINYVRI